jgi:hypothetical protein
VSDASAPSGDVIVHVGTHKTGSTAFQQYVDRWRGRILEDYSILVHEGMFLPSHLELPALVIRGELATPDRTLVNDLYPASPSRMRDAIRRTVEHDVATVAFTAEGLSFMRTTDEVERLRRLLAPRRIRTVVSLRRPEDYLRSFRETHTRWWSPASSDPASVAYWEPGSWLADYNALLCALGMLGEVTVIDYDEEMCRHGSVVPALAAAFGMARDQLYPGWERLENVTFAAGPLPA